VKLHTVFITYNRLELTKQAIESYLETVSVPHALWVADNASTDGTQDWLRENLTKNWMGFTLHGENRYPGRATNEAWDVAVGHDGALVAMWDAAGPTHFQRADNDFIFLPGWCEEVERMFSENERLGQLGLRTDEQELANPYNVGGNCIIRRELWDAGLRWEETPWPLMPQGWSEDSYMSPAVEKMGWQWDRVERPCIQYLETEEYIRANEETYYVQTWKDRNIYPERW